jgi:hypothetical protein
MALLSQALLLALVTLFSYSTDAFSLWRLTTSTKVTIGRDLLARRSVDNDEGNPINHEDSGFFKLPELNSRALEGDFGDLNDVDDRISATIDKSLKNDESLTERVRRQLLYAFDHFQPWEIDYMSSKLWSMPEELKTIIELTKELEMIEETAEERGGWDEYLIDALRVARSRIRMYAGNAAPPSEPMPQLKWPWGK